MSIGINDIIGFGRFKGQQFADVVQHPDGPSWCLWLREDRKRAGQTHAFNKEANDVLDVAIDSSRDLQKRFYRWNLPDTNLEEILKGRQDYEQAKIDAEKSALAERAVAYSDEWGAW